MLVRTATRAIQPTGRPFISPFALSYPPLLTRCYSRKKKKYPRAPQKYPPYANEPSSPTTKQVKPPGPVPNRSWSPNLSSPPYNPQWRLNQAISRPRLDSRNLLNTGPSKKQTASLTTSALKLKSSTDPQDTRSKRSPQYQDGTSARDHARDFSVHQPEFESTASSQGGKDPEVERAASQDERAAESTTTSSSRPLPDLRHGIPSTFGQEFSDRAASAKSQDETASSLDVTEEPRSGSRGRSDEDLPDEAYMTSIEKRRNAFAKYMYIAAAIMGSGFAISLGRPWETEAEARRHPEIPNGWNPNAFYARIKIRLSQTLGHYTEPAFPRLLPTLEPSMKMPYTLVLSLEDLLVTSKWSRQNGWEVAKRPGVDYFLRYLNQYYELVIFTSVASMNADMVIRKLDPFRMVMFPLFREATRYIDGEHVKDLSYLNRDLSKTLIIDTNPAHTQLQPENAVILPKWSGQTSDPHTNDLVGMIPFLEYIAAMSIEDVRKVLKSYEGKHIPTEFQRREAQAREAFNSQMDAEKKKKKKSVGSIGSSIGSMLGIGGGQPQPGQPMNPSEGFARGKMLSDQIRDIGQENYKLLEKQIQEKGQEWLEEQAAEEKKMMDEQMKSMQGSAVDTIVSFPRRLFGLSGSDDGGNEDASKK